MDPSTLSSTLDPLPEAGQDGIGRVQWVQWRWVSRAPPPGVSGPWGLENVRKQILWPPHVPSHNSLCPS